MKWIKNRKQFLNEAKIRDLILPRQAKAVKREWGEKYLDYEEVTPTEKIEQGRWKLSEEDKNRVLGVFFNTDMDVIYSIFKELNEKFAEVIKESINLDLLREDYKVIMNNFNINNPTIDQMIILYNNVFRKIAVSDTKASEIIKKGEDGRPVKDEEGNMIRIKKEPGELVFSNNLVNINAFITDFNNCFPENSIESRFGDTDLQNLVNLAKNRDNSEYKVDYEIFGKDMYLDITHNPKNILNMSISKFYSSCQHLYTGGYRSQILANVFDPNSIPAFLTFDTPITWDDEVISEHLPLCRMIVRNIETFDDSDDKKIFFDRGYPDRMRDVIGEMIEKYSSNKQTVTESDIDVYYFTPDVDASDDELRTPYMDRLGIRRKIYIGNNTKSLYLNRMTDWDNVKVSPSAKIKEIVIETPNIPEGLNKISIKPDWIKFKFLKIDSFDNFKNMETESIAFDKCKFDASLLNEINEYNKDIKKLQILSCDISGEVSFDIFENLEELQILFTLDSMEDLDSLITNKNLKKVIISGDLIRSKEDRNKVNQIKKDGIKVEIKGPVI